MISKCSRDEMSLVTAAFCCFLSSNSLTKRKKKHHEVSWRIKMLTWNTAPKQKQVKCFHLSVLQMMQYIQWMVVNLYHPSPSRYYWWVNRKIKGKCFLCYMWPIIHLNVSCFHELSILSLMYFYESKIQASYYLLLK